MNKIYDKAGHKRRLTGVTLAAVMGACSLYVVPAVADTYDGGSAEPVDRNVRVAARADIPDISSLDGLYFHIDAQSETATDGAKIATLVNSGSGGNGVQTDESKRPTFVARSSINEKPAYRFTKQTFWTVENSAEDYVNDMTVFFVASASELPEHGEIFSRIAGAPYNHNWFFNIEHGKLNYGWCVQSVGGALNYPQNNIALRVNEPFIVSAEKSGSNGSISRAGVVEATISGGATASDPDNAEVRVGADNDSFIGDIGELLFFDRALSDSENTLVERYLEARWGMTDLHDAMLSDLKVKGRTVAGFNSTKTDYYCLVDGEISADDISCTQWNADDSAVVSATPNGFSVTVTSAVSGKKRTYNIGVKMRNYDFNSIGKFSANEVRLNNGFWSGLYNQYAVHTVNFMFDMFDMSKSFDNFDRVARGEKKVLGNTSEHAAQVLFPDDDKNALDGTWSEWRYEPWREGLIYEGIRAASEFIIVNKSDPEQKVAVSELKKRLDGYIARIYAAALKTTAKDGNGKPVDGYFSTYNILNQTGVCDESSDSARYHHDTYNFGCLAEAAVYHYNATGDTRLLFAATRFAEFIIDYINGRDGYIGYKLVPPHELSEEALQNLYELYNANPALVKLMEDKYSHADGLDRKDRYYTLEIRFGEYKKIAKSWITDRGNTEGRYNGVSYGAYAQDNVTYDKLTDATGHAVRANLWYNGIAYIGNRQENADFVAAAERVWHNIVDTQLYITGGTGSTHDSDEAYGGSHELPHDGYCETCASVGMAFFGQNMFYLFGEAEYADKVELEMYNGILGSLGLEGNSFYYTNPLVSNNYRRPQFSKVTPCCVPMFLKFFSELPEIIYAKTENALFVNQYVSSNLQSKLGATSVTLIQDTDMPNGNTASFSVRSSGAFTLKLRMPSWADGASLTVNGKVVSAQAGTDGYMDVAVPQGDTDVKVVFEKSVRIVTQDHAPANVGKAAFRYGSFVYCAEEDDNVGLGSVNTVLPADVKTTVVYDDSTFQYRTGDGGYDYVGFNVISVEGVSGRTEPLKLIPFYLRGNRGCGHMVVWFDRT